MPVYKDKNGTWYYSIQRKDPITGKYKHLHKRGFATKKEATKALMALEMSTAAKSSATVRENRKRSRCAIQCETVLNTAFLGCFVPLNA